MKVLILHSELGVLRGGGENVTRSLFSAFAERGHRVTAAFTADLKGRYPLALPDAIEPYPIAGWWSNNLGQPTLARLSHYVPAHGPLRPKWNRLQEALAWRAFAWHKRRFRERVVRVFTGRWDHFDALWVHGDPILGSAVARYRPTVVFLPGPVTAELEPELRTAHLVCAHDDCLARVRTFLGDHVAEIPLGLDRTIFNPGGSDIRSKLGWTDRDCVIGYVGRLAHIKGVDLLAAGFREIARRLPEARLLIVGAGEEDPLIRATLARELAEGRVHIEPGVDHDRLPVWYRAMDLIVMPSRYETMSSAILEAMACGVPCLASDVGGNRQVLRETDGGWLFDPDSVPSIVEWLQRLVGDRASVKRRGQIALTAMRSYHTWASSAERLEMIMHSRLRVGPSATAFAARVH